jgi:hypothetical protein
MWKITDPLGIKARAERKRQEEMRQEQERRTRVQAIRRQRIMEGSGGSDFTAQWLALVEANEASRQASDRDSTS